MNITTTAGNRNLIVGGFFGPYYSQERHLFAAFILFFVYVFR